jgi:hypothetical protein
MGMTNMGMMNMGMTNMGMTNMGMTNMGMTNMGMTNMGIIGLLEFSPKLMFFNWLSSIRFRVVACLLRVCCMVDASLLR